MRALRAERYAPTTRDAIRHAAPLPQPRRDAARCRYMPSYFPPIFRFCIDFRLLAMPMLL